MCIIERRAFPRHRPGETLHPGVEPALRGLGAVRALEIAQARHAGVWTDWPDGTRFVPYGHDASGPWQGFQVDRSAFDARLLRMAEQAGAVLAQPVRVVEPLLETGRVAGVATDRGELRAKFLVDASGAGHWLARRLAVPIVPFSPRLLASYGYVRGALPARHDTPVLSALSIGWVWTARVAADRYAWVRLRLDGERDTGPPDELRALLPDRPERSADVSWRAVASPVGAGWMLAGDAAAVLDPASSSGWLRAWTSGAIAGGLLADVLAGRADERRALAAYASWLQASVASTAESLRKRYARLVEAPAWVREGRGSFQAAMC